MEENLQADFRFRAKAWCDNTVPQDEADAYVAALWPDAISVLEQGGATTERIGDALFFVVSEANDFPQRVPADIKTKVASVVETYSASSDLQTAGMARRLLCKSSEDRYWCDAVAAIRSGANAGWDALTLLSVARAGDERSRQVIEDAIGAPQVHGKVRDALKHGLYRAGRYALWRKKFFSALSSNLGIEIHYEDPYLPGNEEEPQPNYSMCVCLGDSNTVKVSVLDWASEVVIYLRSFNGEQRAGAFSAEPGAPEAAAQQVAALMA